MTATGSAQGAVVVAKPAPHPTPMGERPLQTRTVSWLRGYKAFLILMLFALMLTPSFKMRTSLPKVRLEELLIGLFFAYLLLISLSGRRIEYAWGLRQTMLLAFRCYS